MANAAKLALETNPLAVVRRGLDRVPRRTALWTRVVVVVREVACAVVIPPRRRIHEPRRVERRDALGQGDLGVRRCVELTPAFVVYDLCRVKGITSAFCLSASQPRVNLFFILSYPGHDAGVAQMLVEQNVELPLKLLLLGCVWSGYAW